MNNIISAITLFMQLSSYTGLEIQRPDINCMSRAIYHEARGENITGQIAVASVIMNRAESSDYPDDICEVVYQPAQFTGLSRDMIIEDVEAWEQAVEISIFVWTDFIDDPTNGALWYYAHNKMQRPWWADNKRLAAVIDNHTFYKEG